MRSLAETNREDLLRYLADMTEAAERAERRVAELEFTAPPITEARLAALEQVADEARWVGHHTFGWFGLTRALDALDAFALARGDGGMRWEEDDE
jgi:hypothetical protein